MKKKRKLINIYLLIASLFLSFCLVELYMRVAKIEYPIFQNFDRERGFSLRPNVSGWWRAPVANRRPPQAKKVSWPTWARGGASSTARPAQKRQAPQTSGAASSDAGLGSLAPQAAATIRMEKNTEQKQ